MTLPLSIDYTLAMEPGVGPRGGLPDEALASEEVAVDRAVDAVHGQVADGTLGFWDLPKERSALEACRALEAKLPSAVTDVLILGIGGSSLGARAVLHALGGPPGLASAGAGSLKRNIHLPDNSDPWLFGRLLDHLKPEHTLVVAISKSGGTVETVAQLVIARKWLTDALGTDAKAHQVFITDPEKGALRPLAAAEGIPTLAVPPNVGGRFSVLSAVGLFPAVLAGLDAEGMLNGAAAVADASGRASLRENPAALVAALHVLHHRLFGRSIHVMMPYADALRPFAAWYVQLWAESLGKRVDLLGRRVESGPTPLPAVGATDQHAQVQLFMEGPRDKLITFVAVDRPGHDRTIPEAEGPFAYLAGTSLHQVLEAERRGTALALAEDGRPSLTIRVGELDGRALGGLFFLYQAATAIAGQLYGIGAFDQPGVELGKKLATGILGRPGMEDYGKRVGELEARLASDYRLPKN
ncbi:MAG: glucose-6-phosphate isomerase [Myxococcota bacterium]